MYNQGLIDWLKAGRGHASPIQPVWTDGKMLVDTKNIKKTRAHG